MRLIDYLDKGVSLGPEKPCLTADGQDWSYAHVQRLSYRAARALDRSGVAPGAKIAILSSNHPIAFSLVFAISRAGCVWAPINPRNEAAENQFILDKFDCEVLIFASAYAPMVEKMRAGLAKVRLFVCLDGEAANSPSLESWLGDVSEEAFDREPPDDLAMLPGTGGTTGKPKGVMLTGANLEAMTAITLMSYPFDGRPAYLAFAPLTHAAGVLCFPILCLGGRIVIMSHPDIGEFLSLVPQYAITHAFLPPTVIYMILDHPKLGETDLSSLQCFWYGAAPISAARLQEALRRIGPMAQLFGQTEAPMMISTMAPKDHFRPDGSIALERLTSAGRPSPLVQVAIVSREGEFLPRGERGEICARGPLVMSGYYKDAAATQDANVRGFHRTGDIGYLDDDNFLYIVDRAKDMIITGGFNVYSVEVEDALHAFESVQDCAVIGLPDDKWGERVVAVVQARAGRTVDPTALADFVKSRIGSVKAPKQVEIWPDLPRSKVGKVLKSEIRQTLLERKGR